MKYIEKINARNLKMNNLVNFIIELKKLVRESGKSFIPVSKIDELLVRFNINLKEVEKLR